MPSSPATRLLAAALASVSGCSTRAALGAPSTHTDLSRAAASLAGSSRSFSTPAGGAGDGAGAEGKAKEGSSVRSPGRPRATTPPSARPSVGAWLPPPAATSAAVAAESEALSSNVRNKKQYWKNFHDRVAGAAEARAEANRAAFRARAAAGPQHHHRPWAAAAAPAPPRSPAPPPPSRPPLPRLRLLDPARPPHPARDVGGFLPVDARALPEAFSDDARSGSGAWATLPRGGCGGLAGDAAWEALAGGRVLYRGVTARLQAAAGIGGSGGAEGGGGEPSSPSTTAPHAPPASGSAPAPQLLLAGPSGAGKSVALATLVQAARAAGWVALYVPSPAQAAAGGVFGWNEGAGGWDAPAAARALASGLLAAHGGGGSVLDTIPAPGTAFASVGEALTAAATAGGPGGGDGAGLAPPVDAFLAALAALRAQTAVPFLTAVDEYGVLHAARSGLAARAGTRGAVPVPACAVRTAAALRVLEGPPPARGADVAALTTRPPRAKKGRATLAHAVPLSPAVTRVPCPRVDRAEWDALLTLWAHTAEAAAASAPASSSSLLAPSLVPGAAGDVSYALTGGDVRAVAGLGQVFM